jgi:hypothetical protein
MELMTLLLFPSQDPKWCHGCRPSPTDNLISWTLTAPASPSYINHPKAKTEEEKVDVIAEELAVKADVEDASQLRLDSVSEAAMTATVWVSKRNNGSTDESVTFGGAVLAGDVLFFFVVLLGRIHQANQCGA